MVTSPFVPVSPALALGWGLGGTYELGLMCVGAVVLVGAVAMSHQHERAFSASVIYVACGAVGAVGLSALAVASPSLR